MRARQGALAIVVAWLAVAALHAQEPTPAATRAALNQYCVTCHNERLKTAGLTLDTMDLGNVPANAAVWEKVVRKIRSGVMPPTGARRPDPVTTDAIVTWLETTSIGRRRRRLSRAVRSSTA